MRVTAAHIAGAASRGYGPRIIIAALRDRLIPHVFLAIDECWLTLIYKGRRTYIHLPLQLLPYTLRFGRVPMLHPFSVRMELPAGLIQRPRRGPRKRAS